MHEIGHGLGFQGFLDKTTGALFDADGAGAAKFPRSDTYTSSPTTTSKTSVSVNRR